MICYDEIASFIYRLFGLDKVIISIDRTNWKWGKKNINIFMLSIVYKGIAIPLYWDLLDKRGNSNTLERIALIQKFIDRFGKDKISYVLADREFVGSQWFSWLNDNGIKFCIRIKKNSKVHNRHGEWVQVHKLLRNVNNHETMIFGRRVKIDGCSVILCVKRSTDNELVIVATNDFEQFFAMELYAKRWEIETLFSCLKGRGFNLEDTHLTNPDRIKALLAVYAIAFCWSYRIGETRHEKKPIKRKNHGRLAMSLFRVGLDLLFDTLKSVLLFEKTGDKFDCILSYLTEKPKDIDFIL